MSAPTAFAGDYRAALERYLEGAGEDALSHAYEIGRAALAAGLGLLDVAAIHYAAVTEILNERPLSRPAEFIDSSGVFFNEFLSPFEIQYRAVDNANVALRRFNELLEEEGKRIAHSLHDQAGSILASARLELNLATKQLPEDVRASIALVEDLLEQTGEQLRHLSHELRPVILDDLGIGPAIEFLTQGFEQRTGLRIELSCKIRERFPAAIEIAIYRIVQEALNNALLHGGDRAAAAIAIERQGDSLLCRISDDGAGFDVEGLVAAGGQPCLGLLGMRERAHAVNGSCQIDSEPGRGTTVEVLVPLAGAAPSEQERGT